MATDMKELESLSYRPEGTTTPEAYEVYEKYIGSVVITAQHAIRFLVTRLPGGRTFLKWGGSSQ